jgi:catechol 2,3-dioxygenase-like lactoylglutathione lyase family enzyme
MPRRGGCTSHANTISSSSSLLMFKEKAMITGLLTIALYASDVERAARFYRDQLGLDQVYENDGRVALRCGPTRLLLHPTEESDRGPWNVELYFQVEDVDDVVSRLRAQGVGVLLEPMDEPWGVTRASSTPTAVRSTSPSRSRTRGSRGGPRSPSPASRAGDHRRPRGHLHHRRRRRTRPPARNPRWCLVKRSPARWMPERGAGTGRGGAAGAGQGDDLAGRAPPSSG